jgi:hypothetical protein
MIHVYFGGRDNRNRSVLIQAISVEELQVLVALGVLERLAFTCVSVVLL